MCVCVCEFGKFVGRSVEGKWKIIDRVLVVIVVVPDKCECDDGGWMVVQNTEQELFHFHETKTKRGKCVLSLPLPCGVTKMGSLLACLLFIPRKAVRCCVGPEEIMAFHPSESLDGGGTNFYCRSVNFIAHQKMRRNKTCM